MVAASDSDRLRIAIIGPGGIGSTFAFQLGRAGHDVTVIARGARLDQLRHDGAIVTTDGRRASVQVSAELDPATPWDLVLVTVLAAQVDAVLPALAQCSAKAVMFMFNTFASLDRLSGPVGAPRVSFGFPAIVAGLDNGRLASTVLRRGAATTVSDPHWAAVFADAGIPTTVHPDMQSWLRTHTAVIVPLVLAAQSAQRQGRGVRMREALRLAHAVAEGLRLVDDLGNTITPSPIGLLRRLPAPTLAVLLWSLTRLPVFTRTLAVAPTSEPAMLIAEMNAVSPTGLPALLAVAPSGV